MEENVAYQIIDDKHFSSESSTIGTMYMLAICDDIPLLARASVAGLNLEWGKVCAAVPGQ
jgi:hypothetical protein